MIELLVVVGIIVALLGILLPAVGRAWRDAVRSRMSMDLQALSTALEAYKQDFNEYPHYTKVSGADATVGDLGATLLGEALVGPREAAADGQDGFGFRVQKPINGVAQGRVYGPYIQPDHFKMDISGSFPNVSGSMAFFDRYDKPILYIPANKNTTVMNGYANADSSALQNGTASKYMFNLSYVQTSFSKPDTLQRLLGDYDANGVINGTEQPAYVGPYILWSAGPDGKFGPADGSQLPSSKNRCDDVANFQRFEF